MKLKLKFDGPAIALSLAAILILAIKISLVSPATFCLLTISLMLVCLFREIYTPALALSSTVVILLLGSKANTQTVTEVVNGVQLSSSNFLPLEKAFLGFSNSAVITIGSLFVVAAAVRNTGAINLLATRLLHKAESIGGALQRMALPLMALSAVFNNTPIVAIFIPSVRDWALRNKISPSKILLPLVYLTSFGGLFTIIGTSTNYFINNQVIGQGLEGFAMFEFSKLAIPAAILGFIYLFTIGHRLLPENEDLVQAEKSNTRKYLVEMSLENGSLLNHKTIAASGLRNLPDIFLFAVRRNGEFISPVQDSFQLNINDRLVFTGEHNNLLKLKKINGLSSPVFCNSPELEENSQLIEVIIPNTSALIGKTIEELWFNQRYDATVIALHRNGENIDSTVAQTPLKSGDTMLMITGSNYSDVWKPSRDFSFVSGVERQQMNALTPSTTLTLITSILMVLLPTFNILGIEYTSIIAAIVITVIKKSRNIFMQLDWDVLIVIGA
ncbi:MAG: SLC13 family permease, partial [Lentisphaeraceae bacterium]|nr:SLC13 family permease [Lentisphaeraceae bacterium]